MTTNVSKCFRATLERTGSRLNWVIIRVPFNVAEVWGTRGQLKVRGEVNGFAFRSSLFPQGNGEHILMINKAMQAGAKASVGAVAEFRMEPDTAPRRVSVPDSLDSVLRQDRALRRWFEQLNYSTRKEIAGWITQAKHPETRARRAQRMAERLLETMEAERELPPLLRRAFARHPKALQGWERMGPSHRRRHLLGIFYYHEPESRARRVEKTLAAAAELADKRAAKKTA